MTETPAALPLCSQCGYDLRSIASSHCPECGYELAKQAGIAGEIPWAYRRARGRIRSYGHTVLKVIIGGGWIGRVIASPAAPGDARRFWLVTATILSLPLIGAFVGVWIHHGSLWFITVLPRADFPRWVGGTVPWLEWNVIWPWSAGATRYGVLILALWLFALTFSAVHGYFFHPTTISPPQRARANAFSYYLSAAFLPVTMAAVISTWAMVHETTRGVTVPVLSILSWGLLAGVTGFALWRILTSLRATTHCSLVYLAFAAIGIPIGWAICGLLTLGLLPWVIGYAWVMIDALR